MKKRNYEIDFINSTNMGCLITVGVDFNNNITSNIINFENGIYTSYIADENFSIDDDVKICSYKNWIKIYDDERVVREYKADEIIVYKDTETSCIIKLIGRKEKDLS